MRCAKDSNEIVINKVVFIGIITVCIFFTVSSVLALVAIAYRGVSRHRQLQSAKTWGRQSRFYSTQNKRVSMIRKEIDDSFTRQYQGCLTTVHENPEMGSDSPIEIMAPERVWEVPTHNSVRGHRGRAAKEGREGKVGSLFFCHELGTWMPKR